MVAPTIRTENLTRRFGDRVAVEDVNLKVAPGQFFGFLGPNGAGKSTTIKMLTGLLAPTSGRIEILGLELVANTVEVKRQIGALPEGMALFGRLTGSEYLNFVGRMYGLDRYTVAKRAAELLAFMQLTDQPKALVTDYSHGMQKKLAMAAAVIHGPKVLFLDEPFEGVDAIAAGTLKTMLQRMIARGATISSPRMCWRSWNGCALMSASFIAGGWWRRARWRNCGRAWKRGRRISRWGLAAGQARS